MKKTLTIISLLAGAVGLQAQGQLNWISYDTGFSVEVLSVNPLAPTQQTVGQNANDNPAGVTSYGTAVDLGGLATGTGSTGLPSSAGTYNGNLWTVGLYIDTSTAAVQADVASGSPVATSLIGSSTGTSASGDAGYWGVVSDNVANLPITTAFAHSATVSLALAAWYNGNGATSYATATGPKGTDDSVPASIVLNSATATPPTLDGTGLVSFDLVSPSLVSPEPSTIALGVLGASAFLFRRRK
jgi:hypothetical protein